MLEQRYDDVSALLALLLDEEAETVPSGLRGAIDPERIAVVGHSFGSITAGLFSFRRPEIKASVFIAAPPEVPLLGSPTVLADMTAPALFIYASEDNSIPTILNDDIINNYEAYPNEAWLVELEDAGHFAFSDLCGTHAALTPGCGMAMRQTNPLQSFSYLDPAVVREAMIRYTTAFLDRVLLGGPGAALEEASPDAVTLSHHGG
jgi:predicted dienelactone hydrolase